MLENNQFLGKVLPKFRSLFKSSNCPLCVCVCVCACMRVCTHVFSHVPLFVTPWTVAHKALLSMEFSREEYESNLDVQWQVNG